MSERAAQQHRLINEWSTQSRWRGIERPYSAADVVRLRGTVQVEHSLARLGAEKFWKLLHDEPVVGGLGCVTGNQAVQAVQSGLKAIYCSGWQVAGDGNSAGEMYPDQSLYPVDSVPKMIERINNALLRTDQIHALDGSHDIDWLAPIIADAEAGFGGNLNAFELTKAMIKAGGEPIGIIDDEAKRHFSDNRENTSSHLPACPATQPQPRRTPARPHRQSLVFGCGSWRGNGRS